MYLYILGMDRDLEDLFEDDDEEIIEFLDNMRTYTIRERMDHLDEWNNQEFFNRFRFSKNIVLHIIHQIRHLLPNEYPKK